MSKKLQRQSAWTPFEQGQTLTEPDGKVARFWRNSLYTVIVTVNSEGTMALLSIRRNDREPIMDWRHLQRIKNELVGKECEGMQLFPAESRLVDTANHYWIFVFTDPTYRIPLGFNERLIASSSSKETKSRQRPFEPGQTPPDAKSGANLDKMARASEYLSAMIQDS